MSGLDERVAIADVILVLAGIAQGVDIFYYQQTVEFFVSGTVLRLCCEFPYWRCSAFPIRGAWNANQQLRNLIAVRKTKSCVLQLFKL